MIWSIVAIDPGPVLDFYGFELWLLAGLATFVVGGLTTSARSVALACVTSRRWPARPLAVALIVAGLVLAWLWLRLRRGRARAAGPAPSAGPRSSACSCFHKLPDVCGSACPARSGSTRSS